MTDFEYFVPEWYPTTQFNENPIDSEEKDMEYWEEKHYYTTEMYY